MNLKKSLQQSHLSQQRSKLSHQALKTFTTWHKEQRKSDAPPQRRNVANKLWRRLTPPSQSNYITSTYMYEKIASKIRLHKHCFINCQYNHNNGIRWFSESINFRLCFNCIVWNHNLNSHHKTYSVNV